MPEQPLTLTIRLSDDGRSREEIDDLTRGLQSEIAELAVDSVKVPRDDARAAGTKGDLSQVGQLIVTLAPLLLTPLVTLLKSWIERKPSAPVKIKIRKKGASQEIEYDPAKSSEAEIASLVRELERS